MKNTILKVLRFIDREVMPTPFFFSKVWASIKGPTALQTLKNFLP